MNIKFEDSMVDRVRKKGIMRVAVALTKHPEEGMPDEYYLDPKTGKPEGVVIDYMKMMAEDLGVEAEWIKIPWTEQIDALINGEVDVLPKHTNTPERALRIDFADTMFCFNIVSVISKNNTKTMDELKKDSIKIACVKGSSNKIVLKRYFPKAQVIEIDDYLDGADVLEKGDADAWVEAAISKKLLELRPNLDILRNTNGKPIVLATECDNISVKLGDQRSINWINNWIKYRKAQGDLRNLLEVRWPNCLAD